MPFLSLVQIRYLLCFVPDAITCRIFAMYIIKCIIIAIVNFMFRYVQQ